ncbi:31620_t:CDS:2, partial [Gigaspora margarita]
MGIFNDKEVLPTRKPITVSTTVPMGLARQATLLVVEKDDNEIITYLQSYINKKRNENHNDLPERPIADVSDNTSETQTNETSDQSEESKSESESEESQDMNEVNFENVKNPSKVFTRGQPAKRRYISSVEKEQGYQGGSK